MRGLGSDRRTNNGLQKLSFSSVWVGGTNTLMGRWVLLDVARQLQRTNPTLTLARIGLFTNLAAAAYCQSVIRH